MLSNALCVILGGWNLKKKPKQNIRLIIFVKQLQFMAGIVYEDMIWLSSSFFTAKIKKFFFL